MGTPDGHSDLWGIVQTRQWRGYNAKRRHPGGGPQVVETLSAVLTDGIDLVTAACAEALPHNVHFAVVVINTLVRPREPPPPPTITTPKARRLACEPAANCDRYDSLRRTTDWMNGSARRYGEAKALRDEGVLR